MRHLYLTVVIIFLLSIHGFRLQAQGKVVNPNDTVTCLKIIGLATENGLPIDGIQVTLFRENEEMQWDELTSVTNHDHRFLFNLPGNSYYSIEVSKPGYTKRLVGVSTVIPDDALLIGDIFEFEFDVELFKEKKGEDDYYLDFPIALISYNAVEQVFTNNANYTKHIKTKISETVNLVDSTEVKQKK